MAQKKKKHGYKRPGETFAQQLAREKREKIDFGYEVGREVIKQMKTEIANDFVKLLAITLNDEGLGNIRLRRIFDRFTKTVEEWDKLVGDDEDYDYARSVVDRRIQQIFGDEPVEIPLKY